MCACVRVPMCANERKDQKGKYEKSRVVFIGKEDTESLNCLNNNYTICLQHPLSQEREVKKLKDEFGITEQER